MFKASPLPSITIYAFNHGLKQSLYSTCRNALVPGPRFEHKYKRHSWLISVLLAVSPHDDCQ
jgi:hypothetical protein